MVPPSLIEPGLEPSPEALAARTLAIARNRFQVGATLWRSGRMTAMLVPVYVVYGALPAFPGASLITTVSPGLSAGVMGTMIVLAILSWLVVRRWGVMGPQYRPLSYIEPCFWVLGSCAMIAADSSAASLYWINLSTLVVLMATTWYRHHVYRGLLLTGVIGLCASFIAWAQFSNAVLTFVLGFTLLLIQGLSTVTSRQADEARARAELVSEAAAEARAGWERERIARELHDGLGAELTHLLWRAAAIDDDAASEVRQSVQRSLASLRGLIASARSEPVDPAALAGDLKRVARLLSAGADIPITVEVEVMGGPIQGERAASMLRCAQELLRNALTHAGATEVRVRLGLSDSLELVVQDNGRWREGEPEGQGMRNVAARAQDAGGELTRHSDDDGTTIRVRMSRS